MKEITIPKPRGVVVMSVNESVHERMNARHEQTLRIARMDVREHEARQRREIRGMFGLNLNRWARKVVQS
jgi:predicted phosphoribosyltransferase